ncbi:MAG TPA: alpha/beta fold hydrolase [Acidimicrobiales bacterium]
MDLHASPPPNPTPTAGTSRRVVLVHGAWHGGWCWRRVAPGLAARGLDVHTPTLAGLGDRAHLVSPAIGLATHVEDVLAYLYHADLEDVLLVGHSYAGLVVREAADRAPGRVGAVALIDAWVGEDGASLADLAPPWFMDALRGSAASSGFGWLCPPPTADLLGVTAGDDVAWLAAHLVAHPLGTFEDRTRLAGRVASLPHHAAVCAEGMGLPFGEMAAVVGCPSPVVLPSGHDAMVVAPDAVADFVAGAAAV